MGELLQFGIGWNLKDPAILPRVISCLTLSYATIGYCKTDFILKQYIIHLN
jgi:CRISPR/Cas system-associated exonuclease Cas4 (RecB family)